MSLPTTPINVVDYQRLAGGILAAGPLGYFDGGAADENTLDANERA